MKDRRKWNTVMVSLSVLMLILFNRPFINISGSLGSSIPAIIYYLIVVWVCIVVIMKYLVDRLSD